jgi:AcrR family transcriptional regulator
MTNKDTGAPRKKRDREASRRRILQAGLEVFAELGYDGATTRMIAERAGLNESLLHRYFTSKEGLLLEVSRLSMEVMRSQPPHAPQPTLQDEIYEFMNSKMEYEERNQNFVRVIVSRAMADPAFRRKLTRGMKVPVDDYFMGRLRDFKAKGRIKKGVDIEDLFFCVLSFGFSVGVMDRLMMGKSSEECRQQYRTFAKSITEGICP